MTRNACAFGHDLGLLFILTYPVADESREEQKNTQFGDGGDGAHTERRRRITFCRLVLYVSPRSENRENEFLGGLGRWFPTL